MVYRIKSFLIVEINSQGIFIFIINFIKIGEIEYGLKYIPRVFTYILEGWDGGYKMIVKAGGQVKVYSYKKRFAKSVRPC